MYDLSKMMYELNHLFRGGCLETIKREDSFGAPTPSLLRNILLNLMPTRENEL